MALRSRSRKQHEVGPTTTSSRPDPVLAWLQFPDRILEVEARAIAFTDRAVLVEWGFGQAADCAWVWRDAVGTRTPSVAVGSMNS